MHIRNARTANERFGVMAAVARRKCSANLQLSAPQEVQWKPPLRQAATTLAAMRGQHSGQDSKIGHFAQRGKTCEAERAGQNLKNNVYERE